ncbi:MAG: hypothetical protein QXI49_05195 [Candidatus Methanomethylicaceae archaeon]
MLKYKIIILLLLISIIQPVFSYSPPNLSISLDKTTLIAGENNLVYLTIRNIGDAKAYQIWISISLPSSATSSLMVLNGSDGKWYIDSLDSLEKASIPLTIYVSPLAAGGLYQITFTINYQYYGSKTETRSIGVYVPPIESKGAQLSLEITPYELEPGIINNVTLKIKNIGDMNAKQVIITLSSTPPSISLIKSDGKWIIELIKVGDEVTIPLSIYASSTPGQYQFPISLSYYDDIKSKTETRYLTLIIPTITPSYVDFNLNIIPQEIRAGEISRALIIIHNNGNGYAKNIQINLMTTTGIVLFNSNGKWLIEEIKPNETVKIEVDLYATTSGVYQLPFTITYYDSFLRFKQENYYIAVKVQPNFSPVSIIDINLNNSILKAGEINVIELIIENIGDGDVNSLMITVSLPSGAVALMGMDGSFYLNKLRSGEVVHLPIRIFALPSASGSLVSMTITASYFDENGKSKQQSSNLGLIIKGTPDFIILDSYVYPSQISPGLPFSLTVSMINLGTSSAQSMMIYPKQSKNFRPISDEKIFIGDVAVNIPTSFTISYIAENITDGKYIVNVDYSYRDSLGQIYKGTLEIPVKISIGQQTTTTQRTITQSSFNPYILLITFLLIVIVCVFVVIYIKKRRS